jgi:hypothetical protein
MPENALEATISPKLGGDIEKFLGDNLALLQKVQSAYFDRHGRYWQGLLTPAEIPNESAKTKAPDLTRKPSDQTDSWEAIFKEADVLPQTWPAQIQIDVYDGPSGKGWTISLQVEEGGKAQRRTWGFGPEKRDTEWIASTEARLG